MYSGSVAQESGGGWGGVVNEGDDVNVAWGEGERRENPGRRVRGGQKDVLRSEVAVGFISACGGCMAEGYRRMYG